MHRAFAFVGDAGAALRPSYAVVGVSRMLLGGRSFGEATQKRRSGYFTRRLAFIDKLPVLYLVAAAMTAFYFCQDEHVVVHIEWYRDNLPPLTYGRWGFGTEELIKQFQNFGGQVEFRPRFLTYFFLTLDYYLRFFLYQYDRVPTGLSILYAFEAISVMLLYKTVMNMTRHKVAAQLGVALYVTSLGFTSGLSFMFMPGKPMTNVIFIAVAYFASVMWRRDTRKLFVEHTAGIQLAILLTMFIGFNFDEGTFFAPLIPPLLFPALFLRPARAPGDAKRNLLNLLVYFSPVALFFLFILLAVPVITQATYGYKFDFISTVLGSYDPRMHASGYGLAGRFTLTTLYENFVALMGTSFIPTWFDGPSGAEFGSPARGLWLASVVVGMSLVPLLTANPLRGLAYRSLILTGLFILFIALLSGRHAPVVDGYYYGSAIAVFASLALALVCHTACLRGSMVRCAAIVLAALPIAIQIDHSVDRAAHIQNEYDAMAVDWYGKNADDVQHQFGTIDPHSGVSQRELDWIWGIWKDGKFDELRTTSIAPGSLYLVAELRRFDQLRAGPLPSGLLGAATIER